MDPLSILLQLFKPGDPSLQQILLQNQLQKYSLQTNNETPALTTSSQLPVSSSFTPDRSQTDFTQSQTSSPLQPELLNQSKYSIAQLNNQSVSQPSSFTSIQQCIQQDVERRREHQKLLTDQITGQHDRMMAMIDAYAQEKEQLEKKVYDLEKIISEKLKVKQSSSSQQGSESSLPCSKEHQNNEDKQIMSDKKFNCPYEDCHKVYQFELSLSQHIKIKHNSKIKPNETNELQPSLIPSTDNNKLKNETESKSKQEQNAIPPEK